ncbi:MAG: PilZ domain-containing protein [Spirochaetales bacterium]|nr:PilZ domain-containing protein [Spirochaetales bacterium]
MKTTIILDKEKDYAYLSKEITDRYFFQASTEPDAHLYHIEHPEVDSYIIFSTHFTPDSISSMIEHVHYLNSIISIIIIDTGSLNKSDFINKKNIFLCSNLKDLPKTLTSLPETQRDSNRIEWPVKVIFWKQDEEKGKTIGNILSISSSGCFIRSDKIFAQESLLLMTVKFKDFDLFTEGKVVRLGTRGSFQPEGLAVQFLRTSPQTKKCIQSIIDEKILGDLMNKLNPDQGMEK